MPISNVEVTKRNSKHYIITTRNGHFKIHAKKDDSLLFAHKNYASNTISVKSIIHNKYKIYLIPKWDTLSHVHVYSNKKAEIYQMKKYKLSDQDIRESQGKSLGEMLIRIAGVNTLKTGNTISKPIINGLHSNRILILNNGVRQEGQQWGIEHAPEIDPFAMDNLEVIKGAMGVRYGADALGGVVLLQPSKLHQLEAIKGEVNMVGMTNGRGGSLAAKLEGSVGNGNTWDWRVQSSTKKLGNYKSADYYLGNTGVEELNYSIQLQHKMGKGTFHAYYSHFGTTLGIFTGAHIGNVNDIIAIIENEKPFENYSFSYAIKAPRQQVEHNLLKLDWAKLAKSKLWKIQYSLQQNKRKEYDLRRVLSDDVPMVDLQLITHSLDISVQEKNWQIGINGYSQVNNNKPGTGTTPIIPNYENTNLALFGYKTWKVKSWNLEAGARYDYRYFDAAGYRYDYNSPTEDGIILQKLYTGKRTFHNFSGDIGAKLNINNNLSWVNNLGLAWRAPTANELFSDGLHHGSGIYEVGNPSMKSEIGLKWLHSLHYENNMFLLDADLYGQIIYNYIYAQPNPDSVRQTIRGTFPLFNFQQNKALFYGTDITFFYYLNKRFQYNITYSLVRAKNLDTKIFLPLIPPDRFNHSLQYNFKDKNTTYCKIEHSLTRRQTRYVEGTDYVPPPPSYQLWNFYLGHNWMSNKLSSTLVIENITNKLYKNYLDSYRYYAHGIGRNITINFAYHF